MSNLRMGLRCATLAVGVMVSSSAVAAQSAQSAQTAEGAQQFLAQMATKVHTRVHFMDAAGRYNYVTGKYSGNVKTIKGGAFGKPKETIQFLPEQFVEKQLFEVRASLLEAIDTEGRPNACATRITNVVAQPYDDARSGTGDDSTTFTFTLTYTTQTWTYEPLTKFMSPAQVINWGNAKIVRNADGSITATSKGQTFPVIHLTYVAGDFDLAARIEYAMKFLLMSCDETAASGF